MVFEIYDEQKKLYEDSIRHYAEVLTAKEELFALTQPAAIDYSGEKVQASGNGNSIETYIIKLQRSGIDKALEEAENIAMMRKKNLERVRAELEESNELIDKVYKLKFLKCETVPKIAMSLNYSEPQIYRILRQIRKSIRNQ